MRLHDIMAHPDSEEVRDYAKDKDKSNKLRQKWKNVKITRSPPKTDVKVVGDNDPKPGYSQGNSIYKY